MTQYYNQYQQPVGAPLPEWAPRPYPQAKVIEGRYCRLEPVNAQKHAQALYEAHHSANSDSDWTYLPYGPFSEQTAFNDYVKAQQQSRDPLYFAIIDLSNNRPIGTFALMRIDPNNGIVEVGHVVFSPLLKQTIIATEAHFLLMRYIFVELGYRRYEWKCDSLNAPSRRAAERLGFQFEGIFRQAVVYKNRSRDTAWFSIIDQEWPCAKFGFEHWLNPNNFDAQGRQKARLQTMRAAYQP